MDISYEAKSSFYESVERYKDSLESVLLYYVDEDFRYIKRKDDLVFDTFVITEAADPLLSRLLKNLQIADVQIRSIASDLGLSRLPFGTLLIRLEEQLKGIFSNKESTKLQYVGQDTLKFLKDSDRLIEGLAYFITVFPFLTEDDFPNRRAQVRDFVLLSKSVTNEGKPKDNVTFWMESFSYTTRMVQSLTSGTQPEGLIFDETGQRFSLDFADPFIIRRIDVSERDSFLLDLCEMGGSMVQRYFLEGDNA